MVTGPPGTVAVVLVCKGTRHQRWVRSPFVIETAVPPVCAAVSQSTLAGPSVVLASQPVTPKMA